MRLTVRHITGSRAGQQQTFDASEVTIGRHPSSMILFDPEKDRVVSGKHASLLYEQNRWVIRDHGSSNGTFIGGETVSERILKPGEVIQLGKNGPQIQVEFESDEVAPTIVVPLTDLHAPQPPREGKTLIMMMPGGVEESAATPSSAQKPAGAGYASPPRKKGGIGRALAIVGAVLLLLVVGAVALAFAVRTANLKKKKSQQAQKSTTVATSTAATAQQQAEAQRLNQEIAQKQQQIAETQATLQKSQPQGGATNQEAEDLKRQLAESQALLEQMTRELQTKNDQMQAAQSRPAPQPQVRYVPVPTPGVRPQEPRRTAPPPASAASSAPGSRASTPSAQPTTPASVASVQSSAPLFTGKKLKKKVLITPLPPEIPPAGLPSGTARDLANLLTSALVSTGDFVVGPKGQASVSVMVTNYRAEAKKNVDVKKTADSARRLGKVFGQNIPSSPVDVKSVAYNAAMSVRIRLYDPSGRVIAEVEPSAESSDRKTKKALGGVSFQEVALSDTAAGDVARKVIGEAIDTVRNGLSNLDWSTTVASQTKEKVTLTSGRNANLEPGDVFEIIDGNKPVARVRITSVTETASEAEFLSASPKAKLNNKSARYLGNESNVSSASRDRALTVRIKTSAYDGPGDSFNPIRELKVGHRLKFHYSVGAWARASDGGSTFWVQLAKVQVTS